MTGGEILIECLKAQGVKDIVGMPGNQNIFIYDALLRIGGINHYLIRNEQSATLVANGYARASGEVGVALTVPGPGSTNASTGIVDAFTDCIPVLLITGGTEVAYDGRDRSKCFHGLDQAAFFAPLTRFFARPKTIEEIPEAVVGAFKALRAPRPGPAVIELPVDVASDKGITDIPNSVIGDRPQPDSEAIRLAAKILRSSNHLAILAGGNVIASESAGELVALAESLNAPVILTRLGKGAFPDGHPLCGGHCNGKLARQIFQKADGLIIAGSRFTQIDSSNWSISLPDRRIQFDPDPKEIGREIPVDVGVSGDLKQALPQLQTAIQDVGISNSGWKDILDQMRKEVTADRPPLPVMSAMYDALPDDAIFSVDVTSIAYRAFDEFPITYPRTFLYPCHSVTLGFAVPAAIGAKIACPDRQVVAFSGDGGFQMTAYELATAAEHGIGIVSVVINDGSLSAIRGSQAKEFDGRTIDTDMQIPHLANMSRALGARGIRVDDPNRFPAVFSDTLGLEGPTVIEVMMQDERNEIIRRVPWLYPDC